MRPWRRPERLPRPHPLAQKYERVSRTALVLPPDPGQTAHVSAWTAPTEEKIVLREYEEQIRLYDEYRTLDAALKNHLIVVFNDPYMYTLKNRYTIYATRSKMDLLTHLYEKYACISPSDMMANDKRIRASYNAEDPLERLDECTDFATAIGEPVSETQLVSIAYELVVDTG